MCVTTCVGLGVWLMIREDVWPLYREGGLRNRRTYTLFLSFCSTWKETQIMVPLVRLARATRVHRISTETTFKFDMNTDHQVVASKLEKTTLIIIKRNLLLLFFFLHRPGFYHFLE
jgi:hypothetical protein